MSIDFESCLESVPSVRSTETLRICFISTTFNKQHSQMPIAFEICQFILSFGIRGFKTIPNDF